MSTQYLLKDNCSINKLKLTNSLFKQKAFQNLKLSKEIMEQAETMFQVIEEPRTHYLKISQEEKLLWQILNKRFSTEPVLTENKILDSHLTQNPNKNNNKNIEKGDYYYQDLINIHNYSMMFENRSKVKHVSNKNTLTSVLGKCKNRSYNEDDALVLVRIFNMINKEKEKEKKEKELLKEKFRNNTNRKSRSNSENRNSNNLDKNKEKIKIKESKIQQNKSKSSVDSLYTYVSNVKTKISYNKSGNLGVSKVITDKNNSEEENNNITKTKAKVSFNKVRVTRFAKANTNNSNASNNLNKNPIDNNRKPLYNDKVFDKYLKDIDKIKKEKKNSFYTEDFDELKNKIKTDNITNTENNKAPSNSINNLSSNDVVYNNNSKAGSKKGSINLHSSYNNSNNNQNNNSKTSKEKEGNNKLIVLNKSQKAKINAKPSKTVNLTVLPNIEENNTLVSANLKSIFKNNNNIQNKNVSKRAYSSKKNIYFSFNNQIESNNGNSHIPNNININKEDGMFKEESNNLNFPSNTRLITLDSNNNDKNIIIDEMKYPVITTSNAKLETRDTENTKGDDNIKNEQTKKIKSLLNNTKIKVATFINELNQTLVSTNNKAHKSNFLSNNLNKLKSKGESFSYEENRNNTVDDSDSNKIITYFNKIKMNSNVNNLNDKFKPPVNYNIFNTNFSNKTLNTINNNNSNANNNNNNYYFNMNNKLNNPYLKYSKDNFSLKEINNLYKEKSISTIDNYNINNNININDNIITNNITNNISLSKIKQKLKAKEREKIVKDKIFKESQLLNLKYLTKGDANFSYFDLVKVMEEPELLKNVYGGNVILIEKVKNLFSILETLDKYEDESNEVYDSYCSKFKKNNRKLNREFALNLRLPKINTKMRNKNSILVNYTSIGAMRGNGSSFIGNENKNSLTSN